MKTTNSTTVHLHTAFTAGEVDPRIFGGFLEHLGRAVYEGVYDPASAHADDMGCRRDVLQALRRLRFTAMRYPGGNFVSGYHWQDAVGPRCGRPVTRDLAWNTLETNEFGPNEFLTLADRMDWTPMLTVNLGTGTPQEATNWLEYCNVEAGCRWAELRREHGYEVPFGVKLWCLGNEMDGPWQIGHVPAPQYASLAVQTARMMKMCDPTIELAVCGSCGPDLPTYLEWDWHVLDQCKNEVEYVSLHRYVGNFESDTPEYLAVTNSIDRQIEATDAVCQAVHRRRKSRRRIHLSFDEWNVWYRARDGEFADGRGKFAPHLLEEVYNLEDALVVAGFLNSFIRHADCVKIANLAQIVNVIAPISTRGDDMLLQTIFYPFEMYSSRRDGTSLEVRVDGPGYASKTHGDVKAIDASAILNGDQLSVFLVNRDVQKPMEIKVDLADAPIVALETAEIVTGTDPMAVNTYDCPAQVRSQAHEDCSIDGGRATLYLPPLSLYAGTFRLDR